MALESFPIHPLFMNYTLWEDGQTGNSGIAPFTCYAANGCSRVYGTDPWGKTTVLFKSSTEVPPNPTYPSQ